MRSSRSKRSDLNILAVEDDTRSVPAAESSAKGYGSFSSFFGRSRGNKSNAAIPQISSPVLEGNPVEESSHANRRMSLSSRRYRALSRSMNDLSAMFISDDHIEPVVSNTNVIKESLDMTRESTSTGSSPSKSKKATQTPFAPESILSQGWLNRRVPGRKDADVKMYRVFLRGAKLYGYRPQLDPPIRAFDPKLIHSSSSSGATSWSAQESGILHPGDFSPECRATFFAGQTADSKLFHHVARLSESRTQMASGKDVLAIVTDDQVVFCSRGSTHDNQSGNLALTHGAWQIDHRINTVTFSQCLSFDVADMSMTLDIFGVSHSFRSSSEGTILELQQACEKQMSRIKIEMRPATAPGLLTSFADDHKPSMTSSLSDNELFKVRQIVRNSENKIIRGTVVGLCRQLLQAWSQTDNPESLSQVLLLTLGLWAPPDVVLNELSLQLGALAESTRRLQASRILRTLLSVSSSLLLDSKNVEALLKLTEFVEPDNRNSFTDSLWAERSRLLSVIAIEMPKRSRPSSGASSQSWLAEYDSLATSGLQAESILAIPPELFASQLHIFHRYYLTRWNPARDRSLFLNTSQRGASRNPLVFSPSQIHFITHTALAHLLCLDRRPVSSSQRAAICEQWIKIGLILKRSGDMTGWLATVMAICAPAVARLKEMWTLVESRLRLVVEREWSPVMRDLFRRSTGTSAPTELITAHVLAPDVARLNVALEEIIPFYGDLCDAIEVIRQRVSGTRHDHTVVDVEALESGNEVLNNALDSYQSFLEECQADDRDPIMDDTTTILAFQDCFKSLNSNPAEIISVSSPALHDASLACESGRIDTLKCDTGMTDRSITTASFLPLLFTDPVPSYRLFEPTDLLDINEQNKKLKLTTTTATARTSHMSSSGSSLRRMNSFPPTQKPSSYATGLGHLDEATRSRTAASVSRWKMLKHVKDITGVSDRLVTFTTGDLILKSSEEETASAPRRRPQSVIMETRKRDSTASKRNSIQTIENMPATERDEDLLIKPRKVVPRRRGVHEVVVKAATLSRLIDLLIFNIGDFHGLAIATSFDGTVQPADIVLDRPEYIRTFLASYRSYCTPQQLIEALHERLGKVISTSTKTDNAEPWTQGSGKRTETLASSTQLDLVFAEKAFTGIFEVISSWLNLAPTDFTCSSSLSNYLREFLLRADEQTASLQESSDGDQAVACAELCSSHIKRIRKQLLRVYHRPQSWILPSADHLAYTPAPLFEQLLESQTALSVIMQLDSIVEDVLQSITLEDWMQTYEVFELQSTDPRGFLQCINEASVLDQDLAIHDCLWWVTNSDLVNSKETIASKLPLPIRRLIDVRLAITGWATEQVAESSISMDTRVSRMLKFLEIIGTTAACMSSFDVKVMADQNPGKTQILPSFISNAIVVALISPQSRLYTACWSIVAQSAGRSDQIGWLWSLVPKVETTSNHTPLVSCISWLFDRMLEVACYIPDKLIDDQGLNNFDKRRYIYNLLTNLDLIGTATDASSTTKHEGNPFLFLLHKNDFSLDWKLLRSIAYKENQLAKNARLIKPFAHLIQLEHEKLRRDLKHRDMIEKHLRGLERLVQRKKLESNKGLEASKRPAARSRYGMNSLLRAVRPISVAMTANWQPEKVATVARIVSPLDLPPTCAVPKGSKPSFTIDLVNSITTVQNLQEHTLRLCTEDGLEFFFQAPSQSNLEQWVKLLLSASADGAQARRTIMKEDARLASVSPVPQFSPRNSIVGNGSTGIFGVDLATLIRRDGSSIPRIASILIDEIEKRALQEVGIYRVSGSLSTINALKAAFDSGVEVDLADQRWNDVNAIAGVFKLWLRELPEPLMTYDLYKSFLRTLEIQDLAAKSQALKDLVHQLPVPNFSMLRRLIEHLEKVTDYETTNHMYAHNLAIVFGPNILQPVPSTMSFASSMNDLGHVQTIIRNLILQCHWIFSKEDMADDASATASTIDAKDTALSVISEL